MTNNITLLYVEDDQMVRENFTEIFKTYFANVLTTDDGNKALELYEKNSVDVLILDISINGINGLSVAEKIRETDNSVIILMISAYSEKEKLLRAVNLNLFGYLIKPVIHQNLIQNIEKILNALPHNLIMQLSNNYSWESKNNILKYNEKPIKLTKNEIKVVTLLIQNKNQYLTACQIQDTLFEKKEINDISCNNIVQLLSRLKKKIIKPNKSQDYFIENCYGVGYKIIIL